MLIDVKLLNVEDEEDDDGDGDDDLILFGGCEVEDEDPAFGEEADV